MSKPPKKYYGKVAKRGVVWSFLQNGFTESINLPTSMVLARLLSPREFGIMAAAMFFSDLVDRMATLGMNAALVRQKELKPEHVSSVFVLTLGIGVASWLSLTLAAPWLGDFLRAPESVGVLQLAAIKFVIASFGSVPQALMARSMKYRQRAYIEWTATGTYSVSAIVLALMGFSYWSLVYASLLKVFVRLPFFYLWCGWRPNFRVAGWALRDVMGFGMGVWAKGQLEYLNRNVDNLLIARVLGLEQLGFYDKAFNLVGRLANRFALGGPSVSFRIFAIIHDEEARFRRAYRRVVASVALINYPAFATAIALADPLFRVLFGEQWLPAVVPFQILCGAGAVRLMTSFASSATQARGWVWFEVVRQVLNVALIAGGVAVLSRWGLEGAALAILVAALFMQFSMQSLAGQATGMTRRDTVFAQMPGILCALIVGTLAFLARRLIPDGPGVGQAIVQMAAGALAAGAGYLAFLRWARFQEVRDLVEQAVEDLPRPLARLLRL